MTPLDKAQRAHVMAAFDDWIEVFALSTSRKDRGHFVALLRRKQVAGWRPSHPKNKQGRLFGVKRAKG